jgi:hypothetical protein
VTTGHQPYTDFERQAILALTDDDRRWLEDRGWRDPATHDLCNWWYDDRLMDTVVR